MKFRKRELWLLLVPLLALALLAAISFAPNLRQSFDDWRLYGNARPRLILRRDMTTAKATVGTSEAWIVPTAFSPDSQTLETVDGIAHGSQRSQIVIRQWRISTGKLLLSQKSTGRPIPTRKLHVPETFRESDAQMGINTWPVTMRKTAFKRQFNQPSTPYYHLDFALSVINPRTSRFTTFSVGRCDVRGHKGGMSPAGLRYKISEDRKRVFVSIWGQDFATQISPADTYRLQCFDVTTGRALWRAEIKEQAGVKAEVLSPDESLIALVYYLAYKDRLLHRVEVRSARTGELLRQFYSAGSPNFFKWEQLQFSPDNKTLLVPCDDRLELWDVSNLR